MSGFPSSVHVRSPLPADPEASTIPTSNDVSVGDVAEQQTKRKRVHKTAKLTDIRPGMCLSSLHILSLYEKPLAPEQPLDTLSSQRDQSLSNGKEVS